MAERDARHCGFLVGGSGVLPESRWRVRSAYSLYQCRAMKNHIIFA
ncbi:hypothetical protein BN131_1678 [Cronobacter malonaticus 681]|nr:hypothetical protein BN131_1678 [Cronobacter malonaticus 681]